MKDDHKHVQAVRSARRHETPFRSPQLTLFDLDEEGWILYWKTPEQAPPRSVHRVEGIFQLPLFDPELVEKAVGADEERVRAHPHTHLHLLDSPSSDQNTAE